jgi:hypothetical protein
MSTSLSSDNVNHDIKKAKKRKALEKKFSAKQIAIRLSSCNPKEAEVYFKEILSYAREGCRRASIRPPTFKSL